MKINSFLEENLDQDCFEKIEQLYEVESEIFSDIASQISLDPKQDFRFSDLSGVDFRGSDLRGFDFTGSDLRGCHGVDVQWDDSTILSEALVSGSLFAYEFSKRRFLANSFWRSELERRTKDYWSKNIEWFSDRLILGHRDRVAAIELAKIVCDQTSDIFLRSQLLFFLAPAFDNSVEHRDYLIHNLSKHSNDPKTVRVTLQALASLYNNDQYVLNYLFQFLNNDNNLVRDAAMRGILSSKFFMKHFKRITEIISSFGITIRQAYLARIAGVLSVPAEYIRDSPGKIYDINDKVRRDTVGRAAYSQLRREDINKNRQLGNTIDRSGVPEPKIDRINERASEIEMYLEKLKNQGVPLRLDWQ